MIIIDSDKLSINNTNMDKVLYVTLASDGADHEMIIGKDKDGKDITVKVSKLPTPHIHKLLNRVKIWVHAWVTHSEIYYINSIFGSKFYMNKAKYSNRYQAIMLDGYFAVSNTAIGSLINGNYRIFENKTNREVVKTIKESLETTFLSTKELNGRESPDLRTDSFIHSYFYNPKNIKGEKEVQLMQVITDDMQAIDFVRYGGKPPFTTTRATNENLNSIRNSRSTDIFFLVKTSFFNFLVLNNTVDPRFQIIDHTDLRSMVGDRLTDDVATSDMYDLIDMNDEIYFTVKLSSVTGLDMCKRTIEDLTESIENCGIIESGVRGNPLGIIDDISEQLHVLFM